MKVLDSISNFNDHLDENNITDCQTSDSVQSLQQLPRQRQLSSFERAEEAISLIVMAFQRQNDVEQGARLGRKNMQVMDRLAKMQAHKRNSIAKISASYGRLVLLPWNISLYFIFTSNFFAFLFIFQSNLLATNAADEYHSNLRKCPNVGSLSGTFHSLSNQVPLIICNVMVGNATGTCYVTDSHILFVTQLVPILGGNRVHLFSIADVELTIHPPSKSMLSPLPASISLTITSSGNKSTREEVYRFIPSIGARRFAKFVEVVKDVAVEDPNALKFSDRGGLIYMYDESN